MPVYAGRGRAVARIGIGLVDGKRFTEEPGGVHAPSSQETGVFFQESAECFCHGFFLAVEIKASDR
jgi:hypothetical protein